MAVKCLLIKTVAELGEQLNIEIDLDESRDYAEQTAKAFKLVDDRLYEQNCRILASEELERRMTPEIRQSVHSLMLQLTGQVPKATTDRLVAERTARKQKEQEEFERFKQEKLAAAQHKRETKHQKVVVLRPENQEK